MCRNIRTLFNFDPPATEEEIRAASLQFVRKLSGFNAPSRTNEAAFNQAIDDVAAVARRLIDSLTTTEKPRRGSCQGACARRRALRSQMTLSFQVPGFWVLGSGSRSWFGSR